MKVRKKIVQCWVKLFQRVNRDCAKHGDSIVPLDDVDYYTEQIYNLCDEKDRRYANAIAKAMAKEVS